MSPIHPGAAKRPDQPTQALGRAWRRWRASCPPKPHLTCCCRCLAILSHTVTFTFTPLPVQFLSGSISPFSHHTHANGFSLWEGCRDRHLLNKDSSASHTAAQEPGESCGVSGEKLVKVSEGREVREGFPEGPWAALPRTVGSNQGVRQAQATAGGQRKAAREWGALAQQQGKGQGSGHKWPRE